ncbi:hypothetical protein [Streptomyces sp. NPDC058653]|uniref:hypothetical protein n=1 Tax=Streptomyces sp. NPDC058653 TaxID=3346576 RepID=UPI0036506D10
MADGQEAVRLHVFSGSAAAAEVESALADAGIQGRRLAAHGSVPLAEVLFAASASVTALAHLITVLRRHFKRGVMVDALGADGVVVKADGSLPRGLVIVRHAGGEIEVRDAEGIGQALLGAIGTQGPAPGAPAPPPPGGPGV